MGNAIAFANTNNIFVYLDIKGAPLAPTVQILHLNVRQLLIVVITWIQKVLENIFQNLVSSAHDSIRHRFWAVNMRHILSNTY